MTRTEAGRAFAASLLAAGYTRGSSNARIGWSGPDGYPATRADLRAHWVATIHGDDRDPWIGHLRSPDFWVIVDAAGLSQHALQS